MKTKKELWLLEKAKMDAINQYPTFQKYYDSQGRVDPRVYMLSIDVIIGCTDGGVGFHAHPHHHDLVNSAGTFILNNIERAAEKVMYIWSLLEPGRELILSYHDNCGAAALANKDQKIFTVELSEFIWKKYGKRFKVIHIPEENMLRDNKFHNETTLYIPLEKKVFDPSYDKRLPLGFSLNPYYMMDFEEYLNNINLVTGISFGNHGFNEFFSREYPFRILLVGEDHYGYGEKSLDFLNSNKFEGKEKISSGVIKVETLLP